MELTSTHTGCDGPIRQKEVRSILTNLDTLRSNHEQPLKGVRVLDLTRLLPGAVATAQLRTFGAELADACVTAVLSIRDLMHQPHVRSRQILKRHKVGGDSVEQIGVMPKLDGTPGRQAVRAPNLGEHTVELLRRVGFSRSQLRGMERDGAIQLFSRQRI